MNSIETSNSLRGTEYVIFATRFPDQIGSPARGPRKVVPLASLLAFSLRSTGWSRPNLSLVDDAGDRNLEDLPEIYEDAFKPMDGGIELAQDEIKGRNTWNLWCAGTEQFWERMSRQSCGLIDRGHYFGSSLPDSDKQAWIEYLNTP